VTGFPGRPSGTGINTAIPDMGPNPTHATAALLAALHYKKRTGKGQFIEEAQFESSLNWMETYVLEYVANNRLQPRRGNSVTYAAPHGVYRCKGEDRWCVIAVFTEAEWGSFCNAIDNPPWTSEEGFSAFERRKENEDALNRRVEEWTREKTPEEVMRRMQEAGVTAAVVETTEDLLTSDEQIRWNNSYITLDHPEGECLVENSRIGFSRTPGRIRRPGPAIGQDNEYVFKEILGMSEEEINQGYVDGVLD
jgi:benzylsuccinate CoA-transferase BbsF subunit